jgi:nicotinate-nucleotide adenylyltransferase
MGGTRRFGRFTGPVAAMQRLGLFGGSFNPVTCGHLMVARAALETLELDRLFFIPALQSPFKPDMALAPAPARLRWLRLALAGQSRYALDDQEIRRGGVSYTVDTVREFRRRFPAARLFWLIGADHARTLPKWRDAAALAELAEFAVCARPGEAPPELPAPFQGRVLPVVPMGVSASLVRRRAAAGLPLDGLVPPAVLEAITSEKWYA